MDCDYELEKKSYAIFRNTNINWLPDRNVFVWWAMETSKEQLFHPETTFLGIYLFDLTMQKFVNVITPKYYQLIMATSLWISTKYYESEMDFNPKFTISTVERKCSFRYSTAQFYEVEKFILKGCNWNLNVPSSFSFLCHYFKESLNNKLYQFKKKHLQFCFEYIHFFSIIHYDSMHLWLPSEIAAACIGLLYFFDLKLQDESRNLFYVFWNQLFYLDRITNYSYYMIYPLVERMFSFLQQEEKKKKLS